MPASPWKSGNAAPGKFGLVGRLRLFRTLWTLNHNPCLGPWAWALSLLCWSASRLLLSRTVSSLWCVLLSVFSRFLCSVVGLGHVPCGVSPPPGRAAVLSLATLEAAVVHGVQALRKLRSRSLPRGLSLVSRTSVLARAPALLCPRPHPVVLVAPSCSISVAPRVFPSRVLLWPRLTARSRLAATPAPRPLPAALLSHGARQAWPAAPLRVSQVLLPLLPPRPLLGRQVRGAVPQAPLKHANAGGTSIAAEHGGLPSGQCGVRCFTKFAY